jgi:hypothetical protein
MPHENPEFLLQKQTGFEVLTAVAVMSTVLLVVTPCGSGRARLF